MKAYILVTALLVASMLFFGCTETAPISTPEDTNVVAETQIVDQEITSNWVSENETVDTGSVI